MGLVEMVGRCEAVAAIDMPDCPVWIPGAYYAKAAVWSLNAALLQPKYEAAIKQVTTWRNKIKAESGKEWDRKTRDKAKVATGSLQGITSKACACNGPPNISTHVNFPLTISTHVDIVKVDHYP